MKCPKCGYEQAIYDDINEWWYCPQCHGSGEVEMTNEEWFISLPTEEKAKTIVCLEVNALHKWKKGLVKSDVDEMKRWLKEIHQ